MNKKITSYWLRCDGKRSRYTFEQFFQTAKELESIRASLAELAEQHGVKTDAIHFDYEEIEN